MSSDKRTFRIGAQHLPLEAACIVMDLLDTIDRQLTSAEGLSDGNIRSICQACNRLRAVLRLLQTALDSSKFKDADARISTLARQLDEARRDDNSVLLATLDRLAQHFGEVLAPDALTEVGTLLSADMSGQIVAVPEIPAMQSELVAIRDSFLHKDYADITTATLVDGVIDSYRKGRKALSALEHQPDDEPADELLRHTGFLHDQFDLITGLNPDVLTPLAEGFQALEKRLGLVHDFSRLTETARVGKTLRDRPLHRELVMSLGESRWLSLLTESIRQAHRLYADSPDKERKFLTRQLAAAPSMQRQSS